MANRKSKRTRRSEYEGDAIVSKSVELDARSTKTQLLTMIENLRVSLRAQEMATSELRGAFDRTVNELQVDRLRCSQLERENKAYADRLRKINDAAVNAMLRIPGDDSFGKVDLPSLRAVG